MADHPDAVEEVEADGVERRRVLPDRAVPDLRQDAVARLRDPAGQLLGQQRRRDQVPAADPDQRRAPDQMEAIPRVVAEHGLGLAEIGVERHRVRLVRRPLHDGLDQFGLVDEALRREEPDAQRAVEALEAELPAHRRTAFTSAASRGGVPPTSREAGGSRPRGRRAQPPGRSRRRATAPAGGRARRRAHPAAGASSASFLASIVPQARSYWARFLERISRPSLSSFWRTRASTSSPT